MKRILILWGVLLLLTAVACTEDKGNYDYVPLNELTLEGMLGEYEVEQDSTLAITMTITGKEGFSESDYDFVWYAWSMSDEDAIPDTLSYEKVADAAGYKSYSENRSDEGNKTGVGKLNYFFSA